MVPVHTTIFSLHCFSRSVLLEIWSPNKYSPSVWETTQWIHKILPTYLISTTKLSCQQQNALQYTHTGISGKKTTKQKSKRSNSKGHSLKELYLNTGLKIQRSRYLILRIRHSKFNLPQIPFSMEMPLNEGENTPQMAHSITATLVLNCHSNPQHQTSHPVHQLCPSIYDA